jgi:2-iminobutanoate/2-iminopropanoate deaminase
LQQITQEIYAMPDKNVIYTDSAPKPVGPYSQANVASGFVYTAGQLGIDPATGKLVEGGISEQTRQALTNIKAVLDAAGTDLAHVVKVTVFLASMDDFSVMNGVYGEFFSQNPPARSTFQVARLPLDGLVEIETVAVLPG